VDFGYTNPFVMQWWAEDPDGRLYLYREIYRTRRLVEDHAKRHAIALQCAVTGEWT
jgi:predicted transcriptional regulator